MSNIIEVQSTTGNTKLWSDKNILLDAKSVLLGNGAVNGSAYRGYIGALGTGFLGFCYNNAIAGSITYNGSFTMLNNTSDYRVKENIVPTQNAVEKVLAMRPVSYFYTTDPTHRQLDGFIAHELQEVVPYAVYGEKDAVDSDGNPILQGIDCSLIVPTLTAALQAGLRLTRELQGQVKDLQTRLGPVEGNT